MTARFSAAALFDSNTATIGYVTMLALVLLVGTAFAARRAYRLFLERKWLAAESAAITAALRDAGRPVAKPRAPRLTPYQSLLVYLLTQLVRLGAVAGLMWSVATSQHQWVALTVAAIVLVASLCVGDRVRS